jgi:hypothetical protein
MRRRSLGQWVTFGSVVLIAALGVAPAFGRSEPYPQHALSPVSAPKSGGPQGGVTPNQSPATGIYQCNAWVWIAATPSGYVIGNCAPGVQLDRSSVSSATDGHTYNGGYIDYNADPQSHFLGCGWIRDDNASWVVDGNTPQCAYGSVSKSLTSYATYTNDGDASNPATDCNTIGSPPKCTDGSGVNTVAACDVTYNIRPWLANQNPPRVPGLQIQAGHAVKWRYIARYTTADGTQWVMVHAFLPAGDPEWVFVPRSCLPAVLPGSVPAS